MKYNGWVYEISDFLDELNLTHANTIDKVYILNVPPELQEIVLGKTDSMDLLFHVHYQAKAVYSGFFQGEKNFEGLVGKRLDFSIEENVIDWDTSQVYYTEDIRW